MSKPLRKTERSRPRRLHARGTFDREVTYAILDAALICHVGYIMDGVPLVTPTLHWREGDAVYWHGSAASRALRTQAKGETSVCLTVTLLDGLVMARSAFHHSVNYRSVMLWGKPQRIEDPACKMKAVEAFLERVSPGRWDDTRPPTPKELKATTVLWMPIDEGAAKIRNAPPVDDVADMGLGYWAGVVPVETRIGKPQPSPDLAAGVKPPPYLRKIRIG